MKRLKITFLWSSCFLMSMSVWASEGVLDTTFHSPDGYVLWDGGSGYDRGRDIALQQDGKILVTGYMTNGTDNDLMVIRFNRDGTLDAGFGTNGAYIYDGGHGNDGSYAIAVQSDNKILVAGDSLNSTDDDVIVLRLDSDGTLDPNFGSNGIFTFDSGNDSAMDLLIQSAYDMCFELLTESFWINWDLPLASLRDWPYCEDKESFALEDEVGNVQVEHQVADDWLCERIDPVVAIAWQGSYIGYGYEPSECNHDEEPNRPDYFMLSLRRPTDIQANDGNPGELVWEYPAYDYDEVLVGYDLNPEGEPNEPVFCYSVRLPDEERFQQEYLNQKYWFSVVAVYKARLDEIQYPWGWTSRSNTFGSTALSVTDDDSVPELLYDKTGKPVDMSFMFFTEPQ